MPKPVLKEAGGHAILYVMASDFEYGANLRRRIIPLVTGGGAVEAAIVLSATLARLEADGNAPSLVVSLGSASSIALEQGGIYQVSSVSEPPVVLRMPFEIPGIPGAVLSTHEDANADMVDSQAFAIARACKFHHVPLVGLRGISSEVVEPEKGRAEFLRLIDERLADAVDGLETALAHGLVAQVG